MAVERSHVPVIAAVLSYVWSTAASVVFFSSAS